MTKILHIDSSARDARSENPDYNSISRQLAQSFMEHWLKVKPETEVVYRDVAKNLPPYLGQDWIAAAFTAKDQRTSEHKETLVHSDTLIKEVREADVIVMSAPMYNYGMPAPLKAWFDQVIREGETISFDLERGDFPIRSTMSGKTLVLLSSSGEFDFHVGGTREGWDHLGPHIKLLGTEFLGVSEFYEIRSEYQEFGDKRHEQSKSRAFESTYELAEKLTKQ